MAIFEINQKTVKRIKPTEFKLEKDLQKLVEENLEEFFNCRFVASEFSTGNLHSGRIDTLALSEENNPVIIEYKKVASSDLLNQSLYYLHWIMDHKGDFQVAVTNSLGKNVNVDWSDIRVICIAPEFKKYDLHAVQMMGSNIELWQYKKYENGIISIDEIYRKSGLQDSSSDKNPTMVEAGRKAAITRKTATYSIEYHEKKLSKKLVDLHRQIREYIVTLVNEVEETPKQNYIAFKTSQNFVCLEPQKSKMLLFLKINPDDLGNLPSQARDVRTIGHFGTGDLEFAIRNFEDFDVAKPFITMSLQNIGG